MNFKILSFVILVTLMLAGCRSSQRTATPVGPDGKVTVSGLTKRVNEVVSSMHQWQSVKMPVTIKLESPAKVSLGGTVVMERGRGISMSLRFMGLVEVGTLTVTDDSITVIDKYHKLYLTESVSGLLDGFDFTVDNLQDILLGRPFVAGSPRFTPSSDMTLSMADADTWTVTPPAVDARWGYHFVFDTFNLLKEIVVSASGSPKGYISYENVVTDTPAGPVAGKTTINVPSRRAVKVALAWKTGRAQWDDAKVEMPSVPDGYRRVLPDMLPSLLGGL